MNRMPLKIGVMGGAGSDIPQQHIDAATRLGQSIAESNCITITGACPGLPLAAARGAKERGGTVIGISPALSLDEHAYKYASPTLGHDVLVFTGSGLMGREVVNIRSSDIVVIVGGSSGTLGELAIAYDEGKLIGVLTGTGGISDMVRDILATCNKETGSPFSTTTNLIGWSNGYWRSTAPSTIANRLYFVVEQATRRQWRSKAASRMLYVGCGLHRVRPPRDVSETISVMCFVRWSAASDSTEIRTASYHRNRSREPDSNCAVSRRCRNGYRVEVFDPSTRSAGPA